MGGMEFNKIFAAVLVAGIVGMAAGIFAEEIFHVHPLKEAAYPAPATATSTASTEPAAVTIEDIAPLMASASVENGAKVAKLCAACHSFDNGGPNKVGPNLWGIVGAKHGHAAGFAYSKVLAEMPGNWNEAELNHFLASPKTYAPGTKMSFAGIKKAQDRADLVAWLKQQK